MPTPQTGQEDQSYFSQSTESGGVFSHWLASVMPPESEAQAVVVAVRMAPSRVSAEPVRQSRLPLNVIQTWQRKGWRWKEESTR